MGQQALPSQGSYQDSQQTGTEQRLEPVDPVGAHSEQIAPGQPGCPNSDSGHSQVWLGAILCSFFYHRWFDLRDSSSTDAHRAAPALHRFMRAGLGRAGAAHATSTRRSRHPLEPGGFLESGLPAAQPARQTELSLSWKIPGLLLTFLLLGWLLLL